MTSAFEGIDVFRLKTWNISVERISCLKDEAILLL